MNDTKTGPATRPFKTSVYGNLSSASSASFEFEAMPISLKSAFHSTMQRMLSRYKSASNTAATLSFNQQLNNAFFWSLVPFSRPCERSSCVWGSSPGHAHAPDLRWRMPRIRQTGAQNYHCPLQPSYPFRGEKLIARPFFTYLGLLLRLSVPVSISPQRLWVTASKIRQSLLYKTSLDWHPVKWCTAAAMAPTRPSMPTSSKLTYVSRYSYSRIPLTSILLEQYSFCQCGRKSCSEEWEDRFVRVFLREARCVNLCI